MTELQRTLLLYNNTISNTLNTAHAQTFCSALAKQLRLSKFDIPSCNSVYIFGNGGSQSIASHYTEDFIKCGNIMAHTLSDVPTLTCFANDFGWENAIAEFLKRNFKAGDVIILISSSGNSNNIVNTAHWMIQNWYPPFVMSGFSPKNRLNSLGIPEENKLHVNSDSYGVVENIHSIILHATLDYTVKLKEEK